MDINIGYTNGISDERLSAIDCGGYRLLVDEGSCEDALGAALSADRDPVTTIILKSYRRRDGENSSHCAAHAVSSQNQILVELQRGLAIAGRPMRSESRQLLYVRPS
jgi:hypothetical protein